MKRKKMPVSERALLQRINRKLKPELEIVRKTRESLYMRQPEIGRYHRIDLDVNALIDYDVDLEELGRELKVLSEWEEVVSEAPVG